MLAYLRRHPARRPEDAAAEGRAALLLLAELRWQLLEHEQAQLMRLDDLPTDVRPSNAEVGALLSRGGMHRQSVRDRRDRNQALLRQGWGTEHDTRAARAADRARAHQVATEEQRLAAAAEHLHALRGRLLAAAGEITGVSADVRDWLAEVDRDHREQDCSRQALVVLGLAAAALRAEVGSHLPETVREVCAAIAQLREAVR
ncbi:hypothetical protein [Salinifilum ghardaiensis]